MLMLAIIFLLVYLLLFYYNNKKQILSPTLIVLTVFIFSCLICLFFSNAWDFTLDFRTILGIIFPTLFISFGEEIANVRLGGLNNRKCDNKQSRYKLSFWKGLLCFLFSAVTAFLYYHEVRNFVISYHGTTTGMIESMKNAALDGANIGGMGGSINYLVQMMFTASGILTEIIIYYIIYRIVFVREVPKNIFLYLAVIAYIVTYLLTARRSGLLNLFIYALVVLLLMCEKKYHTNPHPVRKKIVAVLIPSVALLFVLFTLSGMLTKKTEGLSDLWQTIGIYGGSSIYNYNDYLVNTSQYSPSSFFGEYTLSGIYSAFRKLGFNIPANTVALEYHVLDGGWANTYTAYRRYINDFGFTGCFIICFFIGFVYRKVFIKSFRNKPFSLYSMIALHFVFPLFFTSIEERLFMDVIMMRSVYQIIYFFIFYFLLFKLCPQRTRTMVLREKLSR